MRSYKQFCGVAKALDLVGERWTLLIVRELIPGGRRYGDLHRSLVGITTNLLAKRLRHLEDHHIVARRVLPPPSAATVYELTPLGWQLEPVVLALGAFGGRWLDEPVGDERVDLRWLMVSLRRRYRGGLAPFFVQIWADEVPYVVRLDEARLIVEDGVCHNPDVTLRGPVRALFAVLGGGAPPHAVAVQVTGDAGMLEALRQALASPSGLRALTSPLTRDG